MAEFNGEKIKVTFDRAEVTQEEGRAPKLTYYGSLRLNGQQFAVEHTYDEKNLFVPRTVVKTESAKVNCPYMLCVHPEFQSEVATEGMVSSSTKELEKHMDSISLGVLNGESFANRHNVEIAAAKSGYEQARKAYVLSKSDIGHDTERENALEALADKAANAVKSDREVTERG